MGLMSYTFWGLVGTFLSALPDQPTFYRWRLRYYRRRGCRIGDQTSICSNVTIRGKVEIGRHSHVGNNSVLSAHSSVITLGDNVMIAPNVVMVAFDHGFSRLDIPMVDQPLEGAPIVVEDDVWIAANCTITAGVRLGKGCIVGANSVVTKDVPPYAIVGGVPGRVIGSRLSASDHP